MKTTFSSKSLLDPTQQQAEKDLAGRLTGRLGQYDAQESKLMSLAPSTTINADYTNNLMKVNADAARRNLATNTLPAVRNATKNLWGSAQAAMQNKAVQDTENQIAQNDANARLGLENQRIGLAESAYDRASRLLPSVDTDSKLLSLIGTKTKENIATQSPDSWDRFMQAAGLGVGAAGVGAKLFA